MNNQRIPELLNVILIFSIFTIFFVITCTKDHPYSFWPESGITIKNITWEVSLTDSVSILKKEAGHWILPRPPDFMITKLTVAHYNCPEIQHNRKILKNIDQEVVHEGGSIKREYYRFDKKGVMLLGYEGIEPSHALTVYNPPLILFPSNIQRLDTTFVHETIPIVWNADLTSNHESQKTRIRIKLNEQGTVMIDSILTPAKLCKISLSMDKTVAFGENELIVPDAVMMESNILIAEGVGPVLEWGIRAREKSEIEAVSESRDPHKRGRISEDQQSYYIEVTLHQIIYE